MKKDLRMGGKGKTVVVGVDGSEQSMRALLWACKYLLAGLEKPYHCIIYHVQPDDFFAAGPAYMLSSDAVNLVEMDARRTTQKIFRRALAICKDNNVEAETEVIAGEAKERLCQAADKLGADFLVLGGHGHGFFKRLFLGSVTDYCTQNADCPVIVVNNKVCNDIL